MLSEPEKDYDWRDELKIFIRRYAGTIDKFRKIRSKILPYRYHRIPIRNNVAVLVDISGNISDEIIEEFVNIVFTSLARTCKIVLVPWNNKSYDPIRIRSFEDLRSFVEKIKEIRSRDQEEKKPCLRPVLEMVKTKLKIHDLDYIIIFSSWIISDLNEVESILKYYRSKILAITTYNEPPSYLIHTLRLNVKRN